MLIGKDISIELYHPDLDEKMPTLEGKIINTAYRKKDLLNGCLVKLFQVFAPELLTDEHSNQSKIRTEYLLLSSSKYTFNELVDGDTIYSAVSLVLDKNIQNLPQEDWKDDNLLFYSFGKLKLKETGV